MDSYLSDEGRELEERALGAVLELVPLEIADVLFVVLCGKD